MAFRRRTAALALALSASAALFAPVAAQAQTGSSSPQAQDFMAGLPTNIFGELGPAHAWARDTSVPIVVLGARQDPGCIAPAILQTRINRTAMFVQFHPHNPIIVTGGFTQAGCPSEAQAMADALRRRGVTNPILVEDRSYSTVENAARVAQMTPARRAVLITNGFHMPRAKAAFAAHGIDTRGANL